MGLATGLDATTAGGWRCDPNTGTAPGGADQLRSETAYLYNGVMTGDHYAWALTGLTPNSAYKITFFGGSGNTSGASNVANGVSGTCDSEGDWDWVGVGLVTSDSNGKIIGAFTAPSPTLGLYGLQIEGTMPLIPPLLAHAGVDKTVTALVPSVTYELPVGVIGGKVFCRLVVTP